MTNFFDNIEYLQNDCNVVYTTINDKLGKIEAIKSR